MEVPAGGPLAEVPGHHQAQHEQAAQPPLEGRLLAGQPPRRQQQDGHHQRQEAERAREPEEIVEREEVAEVAAPHPQAGPGGQHLGRADRLVENAGHRYGEQDAQRNQPHQAARAPIQAARPPHLLPARDPPPALEESEHEQGDRGNGGGQRVGEHQDEREQGQQDHGGLSRPPRQPRLHGPPAQYQRERQHHEAPGLVEVRVEHREHGDPVQGSGGHGHHGDSGGQAQHLPGEQEEAHRGDGQQRGRQNGQDLEGGQSG